MIRVDRGDEPDSFTTEADDWYREYLAKLSTKPNLKPNEFWALVRKRTQMRSFALLLSNAFCGKCAFCESRMQHVSAANIDHFRPKDSYVELMFSWRNWLLACAACNTKKGTRFDWCEAEPCLIDPTTEDPEDHVSFSDARILFITDRGEKTIRHLDLNRTNLVEERAQWLLNVRQLMLLVVWVPEAKQCARELLIWAMQKDAPYAGMTKAFLKQVMPRLANPQTPHPTIVVADPRATLRSLLDQYLQVLLEVL